ncbi:MAG: single-stranded-DNA-specific exonuclease RecJ, partial [Planctomycetes bacterium]|nr:single-stranded-DNA-specific exonuclease RecJ [Planctomycetota bacterium]
MNRIWKVAPHDSSLVRDLSSRLRISPLLAQVILARGCTSPETASAFLAKKLTDLHDPETLPGVPEAADRIVAAVHARR